MRISRFRSASLGAAACLLALVAHAPSARALPAPTPVAAGSAWPAVTVIVVAGVLVNYDLIRRFTCAGDFLRLGGPGFSGAVGRTANVKPPPACAPR